jgi:hypothetical protein
LASKEVDKEDINYWRKQIPHLMCEMKKYLPLTYFNAHEHYLINQVEEIGKCGPIHTISMWMVERHLKSLKALVRQRAHPKGSMVERYMVYQTMVYISQYSPAIEKSINVLDRIWDVKSMNKFEGGHLLGKGRMRKVRCKYILEIYSTYDLFVFMYIVLI